MSAIALLAIKAQFLTWFAEHLEMTVEEWAPGNDKWWPDDATEEDVLAVAGEMAAEFRRRARALGVAP